MATKNSSSLRDARVQEPIVDVIRPIAPSVSEGGAARFIVGLSGASSTPTKVLLETELSNAKSVMVSFDGVNFQPLAASGEVEVPAGAKQFMVRVETFNDNVFETGEKIGLAATTLNQGNTVHAAVDVTNNDPAPTVETIVPIAPSVAEGGAVRFIVGLSNPSTLPTKVFLETELSAAKSVMVSYDGVNFRPIATSGEVEVPAGAKQFMVKVETVNDNVFETGEKIGLAATTSNQGNTVRAAVDVLNNDAAPTVDSIQPIASSVGEGDSARFVVGMSNPSATPTKVYLETELSTAKSVMVSMDGVNFRPLAASGEVEVPAGVKQFMVKVETVNDNVSESGEKIGLAATTPNQGNTVRASVNVIDDDAMGTLIRANQSETDGAAVVVKSGSAGLIDLANLNKLGSKIHQSEFDDGDVEPAVERVALHDVLGSGHGHDEIGALLDQAHALNPHAPVDHTMPKDSRAPVQSMPEPVDVALDSFGVESLNSKFYSAE